MTEPTSAQKRAITIRFSALAIDKGLQPLFWSWAGGLDKQAASRLISLLKESKDFTDACSRIGVTLNADDLPVDA